MNKQELAKSLGVSRPTLDAWIKEGLPTVAAPATNRKQGYQFDPKAVDRWVKKRNAAIEAQRPSLEYRIYLAVRKEWWTLSRPLMTPSDLCLVRDSCRTTEQLIQAGFRMSRGIGNRLQALANAMWTAENPE